MTWDEMVEVAQRECPEPVAWQSLDAMFRALRAAGVVQVPAEPTEAMITAAGFQSQELGAVVLSAALSAGQIKPEGE